MFNRPKVVDSPKSEDVSLRPRSEVPKCIVELMTQKAYGEVAQSLGFYPAELVRADLLAFFEDEGIGIYDYEQVKAWLSMKKKEGKGSHWCWRPLREKDIITDFIWGREDDGGLNDGYYNSNRWECRPYERLVPLQVLNDVAKIEDRFRGRVKFFVSDFASPRPDPFIMVRPAMCDAGGDYHLVFACWDEPGFGK